MTYYADRQSIIDESRGMLQRQYYVVMTTPVASQDALIDEMTPAHLDHQVALERAGLLVAAGPFWTEDETGHLGDGMIILRTETFEEARAICERDPMHKSGARSYKIMPWMMNEGGFSLQVHFSDQSCTVL